MPIEERLRGAVTRLVELHEIAMQMSQAKSEMAIIKIAVQGARERLGIDRLAVFLREGDHVQGTWGTDEFGNVVPERDFRRPIKALPDFEMVERAFVEQNYLAVRENVILHKGDRKVGNGWNAMVALWYDDAALGWIACDNLLTGVPLEPFQVEVMKLFAAGLAQALVRGRAEAKLRDLNRQLEERVEARTSELYAVNTALEVANAELQLLSQSDGLTGLGNRRLFDEALAREWGRCVRERHELAAVLLDVDYFKQYNDALGHIEGDAALVRVAQALRASIWRPADLVARYGGEEFIVLLPSTGEEGAVSIAERVRTAIRELGLVHPDSQVASQLTVSVGVAAVRPEVKGNAEDLVARADRALYAAKQRGRNRLVAASELASERPAKRRPGVN